MSTRPGRRIGRSGAPPEGNWRGGKPTAPGGRRGRNNNSSSSKEESGAASDHEKTPAAPAASTSAHAQDAEARGMAGNRYLQMKDQREAEKQRFIAEGLMQDSYKSYRLEDAITLVGLCMDMCPEYERHEREYQQNVDRWEAIDPEVRPRRINHERAVKAFTRPTQGTEPLPSDLRPLPVLQKTLDYLFHTLLAEHGLEATHNFIWDRTRAIRREFVIQRMVGPAVAHMLERIARYHTICLFRFSHLEEAKFSIKQEREQLDKTLQSLLEVYDDGASLGHTFPQSAEFLAFRDSRRAFYLAFDKIRMSKTPLEPSITDPSVVDIIDGFYEPAQQTALPTTVLSGIPIHSSLGAAPGAYVAKPRPGPIERPYATSAFVEHAQAAPAPVAPRDNSQTTANASQPTPSAFAPAPNVFAPSMPAPASAFAPLPGGTSFFGPSSFFGKGPFGPQKTESTLNPVASAFTPQWSAPPAASAFTQASASSSPPRAGPSDPAGGAPKPASAFFPTEQATKPTNTFPPPNLFANIKAPSSTEASNPWSTSSAAWPSSNPLLARLGPQVAPSQPASQPEVEAVGEDHAALAEAAAAAAEAEAEAQAAEEAEAAAAAAEAEAREARIRAEMEAAARRAELLRQQQEEKERNLLREQELKTLLQQREERRRADEVEAELQRQAEKVLAAAAEMARQQAEEDALTTKLQEEHMRRIEMPLIAEEWDRARLLRKMWDRWTARAVEIALILEQREQLARRREEFKKSVKDLVAGMGGTPVERRIARMRKISKPVSDDDRARALEEASQQHAKLWAPGSFLSGIQNLVGRIPLWEVWLSPASSDGASSAWLRTKFGINTESTASDIHRIPVHDDTSKEFFSSPNSPGLIVLEVSHDSEADLQRLCRLVEAIPDYRHYAISLLLLKFTGSESEVAPALKDYIQSLGHAGTLVDARVLVLSATQDMDKQFTRAVTSLKMDLTGALVERVAVDTYANAFFVAWEVTLNSWIGLCTDSTGFNWTLYGPVMTALLPMLNEISFRVGLVIGAGPASNTPVVPSFDWKAATDSASAFQAAIAFLSQPPLLEDADAQLLKAQLVEAAEAGVDFPIYAFPERLRQLTTGAFRTSVAPRGAKHVYLPKGATADSATEDFRALLQNQVSGLEGLIRYTLPSPPASPSQSPTYHNANGTAAATATATATATAKKRSMEDTEWEDDAKFVINGYAHTNGAAKRHKTNGNTTPSPTRSATSLMSVSPSTSVTSKRGARLRAMMDQMRASLRGEDTFADTSV